jgi:AmmeMemoRadiSam system protein B
MVAGCIHAGVDAKKAHLSSEWYPSDPVKLKKKLKELDEEAESLYNAQVSGVRALIVPHAGLSYSGSLAAACFRLLDRKKVRRIVLLAPSHHMPFKGIILPSYSSYRLHSGVIPIDAKMVRELAQTGAPFSLITESKKDPHYKEHALEVELPLIQEYAPRAKIVPLIVGSLDGNEIKKVSQTLKKYLDKETIVVVSSDFTHYGPRFDNIPFKVDQTTPFRIRSLDNGLLQPIFNRSLSQFLHHIRQEQSTVCGKNPLSILLGLFEEGVFEREVPYLIGYDTSASKKNDPHNSVSYVGMAFGKPHLGPVPLLTEYERRSLVDLAYTVMENKITHVVTQDLLLPIITPALNKPSHLFFSLYKKSAPSFISQQKSKSSSLYKAVMLQAEQGVQSLQNIQMAVLADLHDIEVQISVITSERSGGHKTRTTMIARSKQYSGMNYC